MNALRLCAVVCLCAVLCARAADDFALQVDESRGELRITQSGQPVLEYAFTSNQFKPFVRALYAANGMNVLRDAPADHLHHHGLMYAVRLNGINFWEENKEPGHEVSVKLLSQRAGRNRAGDPEAEFKQLIHWIAHTNAGAADTRAAALLIEERTLRVTRHGTETSVDWQGEFQVGAAVETLTIQGSAYNGLGLRFPASFDHVARHQNSAKTGYTAEAKWDVTPAVWCAVTGKSGGMEATVALYSTPGNAGQPRFFSMLNPFAYASVTQNLDQQPLAYKCGERFSIRYLVIVRSGAVGHQDLQSRYEQWLKTVVRH